MRLQNSLLNHCSIVLALLLALCPPALSFAQTTSANVRVLPMQIAAPANAKKLGTIKVGDNATALNCDYIGTINDAKEKAVKMGGNLVKITQLISPQFISSCYRIQADVYYTDTLPALATTSTGKNINKDTASRGSYATLYVYRLKDTLAFEPAYYLHLNKDSVLCRIKSRGHTEMKIYDTGTLTLWAKTAQRQELKLNIQPGKSYYIRCGLKHGEVMLIPFMELMDETTGAYEYGKFSKIKNDVGLEYLKQVH